MLIHGIQAREMNISKIEVLRQGALDGSLDIHHFHNKSIDQFLKVDEYGSLGLPSSAIIGLSVAAGLILTMIVGVLCYCLRKGKNTVSQTKVEKLSNITPKNAKGQKL